MKLKNLSKTAIAWLLTAGPALTLGLLSFGGIYAIAPILLLAGAAFFLSTVYEAEIYKQNILSTFKKFNPQYLQRFLLQKQLLQIVQQQLNNKDDSASEFLTDYIKQLKVVKAYQSERLSKDDKKIKRQQEKKLRQMEKWFADLYFRKMAAADDNLQGNTISNYEENAFNLIPQEERKPLFDKFHRYKWYARGGLIFSIVAGSFWSLGTVFLLADILPALPFLAALGPVGLTPLIIIGSLVAGTAYVFLTYNAITDMINNETIKKMFDRVKDKVNSGEWYKVVGMALVTTIVVGLAITLTLFTAGTWWTVAKNSGPILSWLKSNAIGVYKVVAFIPRVVMTIINPIVMGLAAVFFNIENSNESLDTIIKFFNGSKNFFSELRNEIDEQWIKTREQENLLQILNPFRIIIKIIVTPIKICLFICHLVSIGVTADRVPGVPQIVAALIGTVCEGMEDLHYFTGHAHHHDKTLKKFVEDRLDGEAGHNHDDDIPTKLINGLMAITLKPLALGWDYIASQFNACTQEKKPCLSLPEAFDKTYNTENITYNTENKTYEIKKAKAVIIPDDSEVSRQWQGHHKAYKIDNFQQSHQQSTLTINKELDSKKQAILSELSTKLKAGNTNAKLSKQQMATIQKQRHGFFASDGPTATANFIAENKLAARCA